MSRSEIPQYRKHPNGSAFVHHKSIQTPDHRMYLGRWGTPASHRRYRQFLALLAAGGDPQPVPTISLVAPTIFELARVYDVHLQDYYQRDGELAKQYQCVRGAVRILLGKFEDEIAVEFGPKRLRQFQKYMAHEGYCRSFVNRTVTRVKSFFGWACQEELIEPAVFHRLTCVGWLKPRQYGVIESPTISAVPLAHIESVLPFLSPAIRDLMRVQYLCCMRPGEACIMRPRDIDVSGEIWLYRPATHKNAWRGKELVKAIPKVAQAIVEPRLDRDPDDYLFKPIEGREWSLQNRKSAERPERKTKRYPSEVKRLAREKQLRRRHVKHREAGPCYTTQSYGKALGYGFKRAATKGVTITPFAPNQLRHTIITLLSPRIGHQKAQRYAGHECLETTNLYAEIERGEIIDIGAQVDELAASLL